MRIKQLLKSNFRTKLEITCPPKLIYGDIILKSRI
jgi:hypothetical protein